MKDGIAQVSDLLIQTSIIPGLTHSAHVITVRELDGGARLITLRGFTDDELRDDDLMRAVIMGEDLTLWLANRNEAS
ncbi:hypothetical protein [Bradyrhizobium cenepequi]|uniref:hypothetical protein n=1 Tax=Bradyrhizobium cenepequi TaxID=2821403 RepID=UPI001CE32220|nr:hypothetical protein [Bradyrhizobium cenepequi]MCA6106109.1 hypothetical protein [Bradyrhizobium cenepequi]